MTTAKKKRSLDLFSLLSRISTKKTDYYELLEDHEKKEFQPFVIMRWLTGTSDARQVFFMNELVNRFAFNLASHKSLLYKLMCVATSGKGQRYKWMKPASRKGASLTVCLQVIKQYYGYNTRQASDALMLLSNDALLGYAEELGMQKDDLSKLKKELKTRNG
jgi:hypothetical protein